MVVIEHNQPAPDLIRGHQDRRLGDRPRAGRRRRAVRRPKVNGGEIVAEGTPEQVAKEPKSYTGHYLAPMLAKAK
jgi:hypothetical protein